MLFIVALILSLAPINNPTIDHPAVLIQNDGVHIIWNQYGAYYGVPVDVYKLTDTTTGQPACDDADMSDTLIVQSARTQCYLVMHTVLTSTAQLDVIDSFGQRNDYYYLVQRLFTAHNAPYGPFIPRYQTFIPIIR